MAGGHETHRAGTVAADHWPALDGLRAVAILAVMACHLGYGWAAGGTYGVDIFFVLSGFLITWLLLREFDQRGSIRLGYFYARRALRLFPALACMIVFAIILAEAGAIPTWIGPAAVHQTVFGALYVVGYVGNWARAFGWSQLGILGHAWSLGIEEQFYLIWPVVLLGLLKAGIRRRQLAIALVALAVLESVYRVALIHHGVDPDRVRNGLDTHSDGLMWGSVIAVWLADRGLERPSDRPAAVFRAATAGAIALLAAVMWSSSGTTPRSLEYGLPLAAAATAALVAGVILQPLWGLDHLLRSRLMQWVGRRSYGLYLWHYPIFIVFLRPSLSGLERALIMVPLSFAAAALSYRYIEQPFLALKRRFSGVNAGATAGRSPELRPSPLA